MTKYAGNGQYKLNKLSLTYNDSSIQNTKEIDLSLIFVEVNLYESIFNGTMSGSISIVDSFNLPDILPLYGNEKISVDFNTQGAEDFPVQFDGVIYKVQERHRITEHSSGYTLYFISEEATNSQRTNVQRGFNSTPSTIAQQIYLTIQGSNKKNFVALDTSLIDVFTFGTVKPLQAITQLTNYAYSKNKEYGYLFYEDNKQFNFVPLQYLYTKNSVRSYRSRNRGLYDDETQRTQEAHGTIQHIKFLEENSYLDRIMEGQHGATFMRFDLYSKSIENFEYDKKTYYNKQKSLGAEPYKKELDVSYQDRMSIRYGNNSNIHLDGIAKGIEQKIEIDTVRFEISVYGDSFLKCGECIDVTIPNWNKDQSQIGDIVSGKFLMSDIHHQLINHNHYMQTIMIQKESYEQL